MRTKEMITTNLRSSCQHFWKCIENSMKNIHTDVGVQRVKEIYYFHYFPALYESVSSHLQGSECFEGFCKTRT